jgi:ketosteroid isomerase-like protein
MAATARQMTKQIERYFAAVDAGDVDAILDTLAPRCVLEVVTANTKHRGLKAIRALFTARFQIRASGWHGDFTHATDTARGFATTRFRVRSADKDGTVHERYNVNAFEFDGALIRRVQIWMSGESMLK